MYDIASITVKAGTGGDGAISFRREKFVPLGGADGGDGGKGGAIVIAVRENSYLLRHLHYRKKFHAGDGGSGQKNNRAGRNGQDCVIEVPAGTIVSEVTEAGDKKVVAEILYIDQRVVISPGGEGGRGNARFSRAENRVPLLAEGGEKTTEKKLHLEVKLLADIGVIGMPNVGKSSLLRAVSGAKPTVAAYPFTTLDPVLGVVEKGNEGLILVEVPGLVEGAHKGVGLGHEFLRHVARTRVLLHLVDGTSQKPLQDYFQLRTEMGLFDEALLKKPEVVVINKTDVPEVQSKLTSLSEEFGHQGINICHMSVITGENVGEIITAASSLITLGPNAETAGDAPVEVLMPQPRRGSIEIRKEEGTFILKSIRAERLVSRVDLHDWHARVQLWSEFERIGINRAMRQAGVKPGMTVKIGDMEVEWS